MKFLGNVLWLDIAGDLKAGDRPGVGGSGAGGEGVDGPKCNDELFHYSHKRKHNLSFFLLTRHSSSSIYCSTSRFSKGWHTLSKQPA